MGTKTHNGCCKKYYCEEDCNKVPKPKKPTCPEGEVAFLHNYPDRCHGKWECEPEGYCDYYDDEDTCPGNSSCDPGTDRCACDEIAGYHPDENGECQTEDYLCKQADKCDANAKCSIDWDDEMHCECNKGYEGDGESCTKLNDPCDTNNGGCHADAICKSDYKVVKSCTCKEGLVGDGKKRCYTEKTCMSSDLNSYKLVKENHYIRGGTCGHSRAGDWWYGKCNSRDSRYHICKSRYHWKDYDECAKIGIHNTEDCAKKVEELVADGVCHPNGYFFTTMCHLGDYMTSSCVCQYAKGRVRGFSRSSAHNDVFQIASAKDCKDVNCPEKPTCGKYESLHESITKHTIYMTTYSIKYNLIYNQSQNIQFM